MKRLETQRLVLRHQTEEDAAFLLQLMNSEGWLQYIGDRGVHTVEDARLYMVNGTLKHYAEHGFGFYLVCLKEGNEPVGICGLVKRPGLEHVDIGFAFMPQYAGLGYGIESATEVMKFAIQDLGLTTIQAITTTDNVASIRLLAKLRLEYKQRINLPGDAVELMLFEWNAPKAG